MGCRTCKCFQNEKNQELDYKSEIIELPDDSYKEVNQNQSINDQFTKAFDGIINNIGKYTTPEIFEFQINKKILKYINKHPFKIPENIPNNFKSYKIEPIEFNNGNIFQGHWNEKLEMEGYGKYFLKKENVFAEGIWEKGELKYGRVFLPQNEIYIGEFKNSTFNGKGKLIMPNGEIYEGNFENGEKNGNAKIIFEDGTLYVGNVKNGIINGEGIMKWKNNVEYKGNFYEGTLCGKGEISNKNEKYIGDFYKNFFNGKGIYYFNNGNIYNGNFEFGYFNGQGIYKKNNGVEYEGEWENNLLNGIGTIKNDNFIIKCVFKEGKIIEKLNYEKGNEEDTKSIDLNFICDEMTININELNHLEQSDLISTHYEPGNMPSFLDE